jgi:hypothetical protein
MSISTPGGQQRRPSVVSTGKKAPGDKAVPKQAAKPGADRPAGGKAPGGKAPGGKGPGAKASGGKGGPRRPVTPVKVQAGRPWGPIAMIAAVALIAVAIIGYGGWAVYQGARSWEQRAADIEGLLNFREKDPKMLEYEKHTAGPLTYRVNPAVGGTHNNDWQNCMGDIYDAPIAQEHAVHSLEHGAVWVTYRPDLPKDQVDALAGKVRGKEKMMMSPHDKLDSPISLQAWGYQLKVNDAGDDRIDEFIKVMRVNASIEGPNASCSQGITATGTTPRDLPPPQQQ